MKFFIWIGTIFLNVSLLANTPKKTEVKDPVAKGLDIAKKLDAMDDGFKDMSAKMKMILRDKKGGESVREIQSKNLEVKGDGDKTLIIFNKPRTLKGTKFLSFTHKTGPDDQWLFLPKLKRVKRIASDNKSGPFMGSEFAFEDISSQEPEKYTYKFLRDEKWNGVDCHVVERDPVDPKSGYTRQMVWIAKGEGQYRPMKIEFYDRKNTHLKTLEYEAYKQYKDKFWRADKMKMTNHQTKKSTDLLWEDYKFQTGLRTRDFDQTALKR